MFFARPHAFPFSFAGSCESRDGGGKAGKSVDENAPLIGNLEMETHYAGNLERRFGEPESFHCYARGIKMLKRIGGVGCEIL